VVEKLIRLPALETAREAVTVPYIRTDYTSKVCWLGVDERYYFFLQKNFISRTRTNFSQLWREFFFGGKLKGHVRRINVT